MFGELRIIDRFWFGSETIFFWFGDFYLFIKFFFGSGGEMARKKIREYDSKRLLKEHFKRLSGCELPIKSAQVCINFSSFLYFKILFVFSF